MRKLTAIREMPRHWAYVGDSLWPFPGVRLKDAYNIVQVGDRVINKVELAVNKIDVSL